MARVWHNCSVHCWSCWWQGCGSTAPCTVGGVGGKGVAQLLRALLVVLVERVWHNCSVHCWWCWWKGVAQLLVLPVIY